MVKIYLVFGLSVCIKEVIYQRMTTYFGIISLNLPRNYVSP